MATGRSPTVYVIAGPNGAGKTTFATDFLPQFVRFREIVNAELIAAEATRRRRFEAGLHNFFRIYSKLVDSWHF